MNDDKGAELDLHKIEQAQQNRRECDYAKEHGLDVDEMRKVVGAEPKAEPFTYQQTTDCTSDFGGYPMGTYKGHLYPEKPAAPSGGDGGEALEEIMKQRRDIHKQQEVVEALWQFAANLQLRPTEGTVATVAGGQPDAGTKCSLTHVGTAMSKIMSAFGYAITEEPSWRQPSQPNPWPSL